MEIWRYIKADALFQDLAPEIKNYKRKILGTNTEGKELDFTKEEKEIINYALKQIPALYPWRYIKSERFFSDYLPGIKNFRLKILGKNTRGNPLDFSEEEKVAISKAITKMGSDISFI